MSSRKRERTSQDNDDDVEEQQRQNGTITSKQHKSEISNNESTTINGDNTKKQYTSAGLSIYESKTTTGTSQDIDTHFSTTDDALESHTPLELTNKLRQFGLPIRLFGEVDDDANNSRWMRLREALAVQHQQLASMTEQNEFRLAHGHGIRNPFLERNEDVTAVDATTTEEKKPKNDKAIADQEEEDVSNDPNKRIHRYWKGLLKQWEDDLVNRLDEEKRSVAGRNETNTYKQCKDYIRPLFKLCKKRQLEESIVSHLVKIIDFCEQEEFVKANDVYLDLTIGRAAWPIGVTSVGIHSRTGREKIASNNVAHVMNSELQRKYLTSVKRLMTFAQRKSKADPSKKM
jgi:pre-mRNA-splicing factor 18